MGLKTCSQKGLCMNVQSSITHIVRKWRQPKRPSTEEWINKTWYISIQWNIQRPYKKMKCKYMLPPGWALEKDYAKCKKPDTKATYCKIPFTWNAQNMQIHREKADSSCQRLWEGENREWLLMCKSFLGWWEWELGSGDHCTTFEHTKNHELYTVVYNQCIIGDI